MSDCGRDCGCRGEPSRRDVLKVGIGTAGVIAGLRDAQAAPGAIPPGAKAPPPKEWFDQLEKPGEPIAYTGEQLRNLIFPLGGIGTGTVWLHGSGRLVNWQIFNNIQKDTLVDDTFFAVRIEQQGKPPIVRALQQQSVGPIAGIADVRFVGQYPVANLTFRDPALPVELELEAFNPLIPLNEKDSAIPCAIFTLRATNKSDRAVRISFLGSLQNAVGHSGAGASRGTAHVTYGGNINRSFQEAGMTAVAMHAEPGKPAQISPPVELLVDHHEISVMTDSPVEGLSFTSVGVPRNNPSLKAVCWLAGGNLRQLGGSLLVQIAGGVRDLGEVLLLSGVDNPLMDPVRATVPEGTSRRETVFATFDNDSFGKWTTEGQAFRRPQHGTAANQNPVTGFVGTGLVNSFDPDDSVQGVLTSQPFPIKEKYISLLIGGGAHPGSCCVNLRIDGKIVRTATGKNTEQLERVEWDVADAADKEAIIEIVDRQGGGWGHVLVDDIRFSNLPIDAITPEDAQRWNALLADAKQGAALSPANVGKGKVMLVPVELGRARPGADRIQQRDQLMKLVASLAGATFKPATGRPGKSPSFGTMCLATPDPKASIGRGWANHDRDAFFRRWEHTGTLRVDEAGAAPNPQAGPSEPGQTFNAALCVEAVAEPGAVASAVFVMAWHFPHQYYPQNSWRAAGGGGLEVGNMYANWFHDAPSVAKHVITDLENLRRQTFAFRKALFDTTLPQYLVDAVAANVSILRGPTCFWTKDGTFYGFEGCNLEGGGCCPMNCNHVWNYEQTLAKLWPELERNMRVTELKYHQQENGGINHRVEVPRTNPDKRQFPVADGQCGAVLKAFREHLQSPDRRFLDDHWPLIRKAMDFAISEWDADGDGVMEKPQFNTYDRVIFGHNTFVSSLYLAALRAAEEMARRSKDAASADRYHALYEKGRAKIAETLFNGEYYIQKADNLNLGYGTGCFSDQVVGQWWARVLNLGDILPKEQVQSALKAVFKHNWLWLQEGFEGTQRFLQFADGKDMGLLIASWPKGGRPEDPILYRDEIWTGVEYQVAAHKIYEGQVTEGLAIVKGARGRYDGTKKSPWNEIECGDYYARAMSSWSLLLAAQGYQHDGPARVLGFGPRVNPENHRSLFTAAQSWGTFEQKRTGHTQTNTIALVAGRCDIGELRFALPVEAKSVKGTARIEDRDLLTTIKAENGWAMIELNAPVTAQAGKTILVNLEWS